ncbi:helix-turn-helix domain-containing protein [Vibrio splendidus]
MMATLLNSPFRCATERLAQAVTDSPLTQEAIATKSGLGRRFICHVVARTANPTLANYLCLCETLGVDLTTIFDPVEPRNKDA